MELQFKARTKEKKLDAKRMLREGSIPAVVYSPGKEAETISVERSDFLRAMRSISPGHLPNTIFNLNAGKRTLKAIVKDIQYRRTNYEVIHLDFFELSSDASVNVSIPVELVGVADCVGTKAGGTLRLILRHIDVKAPAKSFPKSFTLNVKDLAIGQSIRLSDIDLPNGVTATMSPETVIVVVSKK